MSLILIHSPWAPGMGLKAIVRWTAHNLDSTSSVAQDLLLSGRWQDLATYTRPSENSERFFPSYFLFSTRTLQGVPCLEA